jgi:hypothetical protein
MDTIRCLQHILTQLQHQLTKETCPVNRAVLTDQLTHVRCSILQLTRCTA